MRMPRCRFTVRRMMVAVVIAALALYAARVYRDGFATHRILLGLRYGGLQTRRQAAREVHLGELGGMFTDLLDGFQGGLADPGTAAERTDIRRRRATLLMPALAVVAVDRDPECRALAMKALSLLAASLGTDADRRRAADLVLAALADPDPSVRGAACGSFPGLLEGRGDTVVEALGSSLGDPAPEVRRAAARALGMLGVIHRETQAGVAPLLMRHLAGRDDPRVRVEAVRSLGLFGVDQRRHPVGGPDVAPALVAALRDPVAEVRREAARVLGSSWSNVRGGEISSWAGRGGLIAPALTAMLGGDEDDVAREEAALALFALGDRSRLVLESVERGARSGDWSRSRRSSKALDRLRSEGRQTESE